MLGAEGGPHASHPGTLGHIRPWACLPGAGQGSLVGTPTWYRAPRLPGRACLNRPQLSGCGRRLNTCLQGKIPFSCLFSSLLFFDYFSR